MRSGRQVVEVLESLGWKVVRQRGSHIILVRAGHRATLSVPDHKELARGTLRTLLRAANISADEFEQAAERAK